VNKKKILMITSETVPFAKTGGLADVITDLAVELKKQGHDVRILMPRYYHIDRVNLQKHPQALSVWMDGKEEWLGVFEASVGEGESVCPVYFMDHERYFGREGIYGPRPDEAFFDNAARYALMCRGTFQLCRMLHWIPDILHCHDWTASPVCYLLQREERFREFGNTAGILTIHNLGYQGIFGLEESRFIQKDVDSFSLSVLEFEGNLNFLKAGIMSANKITTVSPTYAREIQEPEQGFNLNGLLSYRKEDLKGILNGVNYTIWNPEQDPHLGDHTFSLENIRPKVQVKRSLQKEMGLPVDSKVPLVGIITRLVDQKGINELFSPHTGAVERICQECNIQFALLGSGETWCEEEIRKLQTKYPHFRAYLGYNEGLAHRIEGGSDFFLMPSRYEPCGLNQIYSLSYGTLPIVRATGGLADTVENYDQKTGSGTGFVFHDLNQRVIYDVMKWVTETWYERRTHIRKMRKKAMSLRYTWSKSAHEYNQVYDEALQKLKQYPKP
jgi:starch synthase